jgi:hypothetical protein
LIFYYLKQRGGMKLMKKWGFPFGWTKESEVNRFDGEQLFLWKQPEMSFLGTDPSATDPPDTAPVFLMNRER